MNVRRGLAAILAAGMIIAIAGGAMAQTATPATAPTVFTFADTLEPSSLNPLVGFEGTDYTFWAINYNLPIEFSAKDFSPDLEHSIVTSVDTSSDGMTFTYHMRSGMEWSDGQPFTANDVAWTLNFYKKYEIANYISDLALMDVAKATNDTTFVMTTTHPTSVYSGATVFLYDYILPEHIWGKYEDDPKGAKALANVPSVGSGPYIMTDYKQGQSVTLEKNPRYWGLAAGLTPTYDKIVYVIYNNEDSEAAALQNGEIDFGFFNSGNILNTLRGKPNISVRGGLLPRFEEIGINTGSAYQTNPAGGFTPHGDGAHALTDRVVRRAIRQAVDDQTIVDKVLLGYGIPADSPVQPGATTGDWNPTPEQELPFDIDAANASLDAAGYAMGPDGVRIDPFNDEPLEFRYYTRNKDQNTIETAPFVKDWLAEIGIKIDISTFSDGALEKQVEAGTYDLFDWDWYPNPDPNYILGVFTCDQRPPAAGVYKNSDSYYCNPTFDALFAKQLHTTDPAARTAIVHQMQSILYDDEPYVTLYYNQTLEAFRTDHVTGFSPQPADTATVKGDALATYGPFSFISIRPVVGSSSGSAAAKGASATVWIVLVGAVAVLVGGIVALGRRRRHDEDRA